MSATALTVESVLASLTLEEKAGLMFHSAIFMNPDGSDIEDMHELIAERHLNTFNIYYAPEPRIQAEWHNRLQEIAASTRSGHPDHDLLRPAPRLRGQRTAPAWSADGFSQWPEPIGFGALARRGCGRGVRRHRAAGVPRGRHPASRCIRWPISPPSRAGRAIMHTFGEDAELAARLVAAYIRGFQGATLGPRLASPA